MSVSSHRKLNVEQLINLAQVYWDDPTKLMEIADASGGRVDPAAQLLSAAVNGRLNRLRTDPMRALGETPPDLAALIAARLGKPAKGTESQDGGEAPAAERAPPRRRWPWAAAAAVLLLGAGAAWWLWPQTDPEIAEIERRVGIDIREGGLQAVEEKEKRTASSSSPLGRRQPQIQDIPHLERELREAEAHAADAKIRDLNPRALQAAEIEDEELKPGGQAAAGSPAASATAGGGGTSAERAAERAAAAARVAARANADGRARASAAIDIDDAQLQCVLTDSRPTACAPTPRGGGGGASAGAGQSGPQSASTAAARGPASGSASAAAPRGAAANGEMANPGERGGGQGSGGAASGGGSPSGAASADGESSRSRRPSASTSAGGAAKPATAATSPTQAAKAEVTSATSPDPECPEAPPEGRVVFVFDGSISMGLPLGVDPAEEDRLDAGVRRRDPEARREYRALLQQPGPKRMGRAQAAFANAAAELPESVELGLLVFQECRDIREVGIFDGRGRGNAIDYIDRLVPRGRTPLAQSLARAAGMLGEGRSSIVVLTDGIEFCQGDPCAVAAEIKSTHPGTPIHIVDVTGQARTTCVAETTGGRSYAPTETDDLSAVLRTAFRGAAPRCAAAP